MKRITHLSVLSSTIVMLVALGVMFIPLASAQEPPDPETLRKGAELYVENCVVCHGAEGEGRVGATLAKDWPAIRPDLQTREAIVNGVAGSFMPPWSVDKGGPLTSAEIDSIVAYILSWQTGEAVQLPLPTSRPPITPVPDVEGDPNRGAVIYDQNCAVCHGQGAEGRVGATLAKDWPAIRTDLRLKEVIVDGVAGSFMPYWSQENGGPLTEGEIDDVVAYILTLSPAMSQEEPTDIPVSQATPVADTPVGGNIGLIIGGVLLVLIILGGVVWAIARDGRES